MHSRNPYRIAPDFEALACSYRPLVEHIRGGTIDFHDDAAQRCLTQALLKRDFNLEIQLPPDRLCPPVPNRLNYILWIQDIVRELCDVVPFVVGRCHSSETTVCGLDIGTGASAIYPLLGCTLEPTWTFVATELDYISCTYAQDNVRSNGLSNRIHVVKVDENAPECGASKDANKVGEVHFEFNRLFAGTGNEDGVTGAGPSALINTEVEPVEEVEIQFTMCNPPFYSSAEDVTQSEARKEHSAFGVCTGAPVEMITPGGEARFVSAMVRESVGERKTDKPGGRSMERHEGRGKRRRLDDESIQTTDTASTSKIAPASIVLPDASTLWKGTRKELRWYTSMLGKMGSVAEIVGVFKELGITNYAITEFVQGHTRRWAVGWSVGPWRVSDDIARIANPNPTLQRLLPPHNTLRSTIDFAERDVKERLQAVLSSVEDASVTVLEEKATIGGSGSGRENDAVDGNGAAPKRVECKFVVSAMRDTWSRGARRKRKRAEPAGNAVEGDKAIRSTPADVDPDPALICVIVILSGGQGTEMDMEVRWVYGRERTLLESFASHMGKKVKLELKTPGGVK